MRLEKRVGLENSCRFVVPEDQDYWVYQEPAAEDIKRLKDKFKR